MERSVIMDGEEDFEPYFNMSDLPAMCQLFNNSILDQFNLTEHCSTAPGLPPIFHTFLNIFYGLVCLVGLCGNTLVIYVVLRYSKMQTVTYIYILMLAIAGTWPMSS